MKNEVVELVRDACHEAIEMNSKLWYRIALTFAAILAAAATLWGNPVSDSRLVHKYEFGAAPGGREYFDYITVDPESRRVYLSHGTDVLVVNADTGALEGKVSGLKLSHGVAVVPASGRGFISDGARGCRYSFP